MSTRWQDLKTKGFLVVPSFLSAEELTTLNLAFEKSLQDPNASGVKYTGVNYDWRMLDAKTTKSFTPKLIEASAQIQTHALINADRVTGGLFFATNLICHGWHTDDAALFLQQDTINYLNIWIPIHKPDRRKSGLSIVGFDRMKSKYPEMARRFIGHGATFVQHKDQKTIFRDRCRNDIYIVNEPHVMDNLAETPELSAGGALIMRGDVFHKSQDADTPRIAISFRMDYSMSVINRHKLTSMGSAKFLYLAGNRNAIARRIAAFEIASKDNLYLFEVEALVKTLQTREHQLCQQLKVETLSQDDFNQLVCDLTVEYFEKNNGLTAA